MQVSRRLATLVLVAALTALVLMGSFGRTRGNAQQAPTETGPPTETGAPSELGENDAQQDSHEFVPPATEKSLEEMLKESASHIARLRENGNSSQANCLAEQLRSAKAPLDPSFQIPPTDELELHVVGLYQGAPYSLARFKAVVKITHRSAPMVLCLTAYHSVAWHIELEPGVSIRQVILGGHEPQ